MYQVTKVRAQQLMDNDPHRFCPIPKKKLKKAMKDHLEQLALEDKLRNEKEFAETKRKIIKEKFSIEEKMMYKIDFKEGEFTGKQIIDMLMEMHIDLITKREKSIANQISKSKPEDVTKTFF